MGTVGGEHRSFDFGTYDYRVTRPAANPEQYSKPRWGWGHDPISTVCPIDLYDENTKELLDHKLEREIEPRCGVVMQDIPGTLQGNWFYGEESGYSENQLSFVHQNIDPTLVIIAIGGTFTDAARWRFTPTNTGKINREFSQVTPDGNIYCYEKKEGGSDTRIIVEMVSDTKLKIEQQSGDCSGTSTFRNPTIYNR